MPPKNPNSEQSQAPEAPQSSIPGAGNFDPEFEQWKAGRGETATTPGDLFDSAEGGGLTVRVHDGVRSDVTGLQELTISQMMRLFYGWSDAKVQSLARQLSKAGFDVGEVSPRDAVWAGFQAILMEAAKRYAADPSKAPTVEQLLRHYMKNPVGDVSKDKRPESYTQPTTSLTDPSSARALLDKVLATELGRDPTGAEKAAFIAALNTAEKQNPVKTTYKLNPATGQYAPTVAAGGIDTEEFARQWVEDDGTRSKERKDYQTATTYFDALLSAIQSPVQ